MQQDNTLEYLIVGIIVLLLSVVIARWTFRIDKQIKNQQAIIWLLINLCLKAGVDDETISRIKAGAEIK